MGRVTVPESSVPSYLSAVPFHDLCEQLSRRRNHRQRETASAGAVACGEHAPPQLELVLAADLHRRHHDSSTTVEVKKMKEALPEARAEDLNAGLSTYRMVRRIQTL